MIRKFPSSFTYLVFIFLLGLQVVGSQMTLEDLQAIEKENGTEPCIYNGVVCYLGRHYCSKRSRNCEDLFPPSMDEETRLEKCCLVLNGTVNNANLYNGCLFVYGRKHWENDCKELHEGKHTSEDKIQQDNYHMREIIAGVFIGLFISGVVAFLILIAVLCSDNSKKPLSIFGLFYISKEPWQHPHELEEIKTDGPPSGEDKDPPAKENDRKIHASKQLENINTEEQPMADARGTENEEEVDHPAEAEARQQRAFHNNNNHDTSAQFVPSGLGYTHPSGSSSTERAV